MKPSTSPARPLSSLLEPNWPVAAPARDAAASGRRARAVPSRPANYRWPTWRASRRDRRAAPARGGLRVRVLRCALPSARAPVCVESFGGIVDNDVGQYPFGVVRGPCCTSRFHAGDLLGPAAPGAATVPERKPSADTSACGFATRWWRRPPELPPRDQPADSSRAPRPPGVSRVGLAAALRAVAAARHYTVAAPDGCARCRIACRTLTPLPCINLHNRLCDAEGRERRDVAHRRADALVVLWSRRLALSCARGSSSPRQAGPSLNVPAGRAGRNVASAASSGRCTSSPARADGAARAANYGSRCGPTPFSLVLTCGGNVEVFVESSGWRDVPRQLDDVAASVREGSPAPSAPVSPHPGGPPPSGARVVVWPDTLEGSLGAAC